MTLMTQENALVYAKKIIDIHPGTLREPEGLLIHLEVTGDIAGETYDLAESHYGPLPMKREEVVLGGTLHDIGRAMRGDQTFHELRGSLWIQENGHIEGVATTLEEVYKIAQIVLPHGLVYERWIDPSEKVVKQREEWEPFDISRLLPRTWQEAIVSHAEISNAQGERLDWRIRAQKNLDKYTNDEKILQ